MPLLGPNGQPLSESPPPGAMPVEEATSAPSEPTGPIECTTAFLIYQLGNGLWQVSDDIDLVLVPERKCHGDDITSACATIQRDAATREFVALAAQQLVPAIAQQVVQAQVQVAGAIRQQAEAAKVAQQLEEDKNRRAGRR